MAELTTKQLFDDLAFAEGKHVLAEDTVRFGLDDQWYRIDLSEDNAERLRKLLAEFIEHAHLDPGPNHPQESARQTRERNATVRAWAREQGIEMNDRGRIPAHIHRAYEEEHDSPEPG